MGVEPILAEELTLKVTEVPGQTVVDVEEEIVTEGVDGVLVRVTVLLFTVDTDKQGAALDTI